MGASPAEAAKRPDRCEAPLPRPGATFAGPVDYVMDGDSICVRTASGLVEVRIADFNAPELHERGRGAAAKAAMKRIALGRQVVCKADHRSYDRMVSVCRLNGVSLGDLMRAAGIEEGGN
ncbi:MAG: nuclease [Caulobacter sp.]|nr:nuclease [Caulobacter sp.]